MRNMTKTVGKDNPDDSGHMLLRQWPDLQKLLFVPQNQRQYAQLSNLLETVLDAGGANEKNPLASLADVISTLMTPFEAVHFPVESITPQSAVRSLMENHNLTQADLAEIFGSQGNVSQFLNGHRALNLRQVKALAQRFNVSPDTFL